MKLIDSVEINSEDFGIEDLDIEDIEFIDDESDCDKIDLSDPNNYNLMFSELSDGEIERGRRLYRRSSARARYEVPLQYKRNYTTLNSDQLNYLINKCIELNWEALDLTNCGIEHIPNSIGKLKSVRNLKLGNSGPPEVKTPNNNTFVSLPEQLFTLENLEILDLHGMHLKVLPNSISKLKKLKNLSLNGNDFAAFPECIYELSNLELLTISSGEIVIDSRINKLQRLQQIYMPKADIKILPDEIGELKDLKVLYLRDTKLENFPKSLRNLKNLGELNIEGTPISDGISPEIFEQKPSDVIEYVLRYHSDDHKVVTFESKMIIVGQGGVGKTCLANRIVKNDYIENPSTEGIDIKEWRYNYKDKDYKLNIWDFGGQEIYHSTHQFFLTKRSLYILVWDARQEDEYGRIDYWLNTIESYADDSPIIIVLNKCDQRKRVVGFNVNALSERFEQIVDMFKVSCYDGKNIDILLNEIKYETSKLPLMGTVWFSEWLSIRRELEVLAKSKHIIDFNEYLDICSNYNIDDAEARSLSRYLHDLGIILHFSDDIRLSNIVILNPEWGTNAVYKVLDSYDTVLDYKDGLLDTNLLPYIWDDSELYPSEIYYILIALMEKFQLSFKVDDSSYLIPELLSNTELSTKFEFSTEKSFVYRISYDFLPSGIVCKLIVNLHQYIMEDDSGNKLCWRNGVYFKNETAVALVKLNDIKASKYIEIRVIGEDVRDKQMLLFIIRSGMDKIHKSISKLTFTQSIKCNCSPDCDYLHDVEYLRYLETNGKKTERCHISLKNVSVSNLLNGYEMKENSDRRNEMGYSDNKNPYASIINVNPEIIVSPSIEVKNESSIQNTNNISITVEIKSYINDIRGCLTELNYELVDPSVENDINKIKDHFAKMSSLDTKDEIIESGCLNKLRRFIDKCSDENSKVGKAIKVAEDGYLIVKDIVDKYNGIARWCGLPLVPPILP